VDTDTEALIARAHAKAAELLGASPSMVPRVFALVPTGKDPASGTLDEVRLRFSTNDVHEREEYHAKVFSASRLDKIGLSEINVRNTPVKPDSRARNREIPVTEWSSSGFDSSGTPSKEYEEEARACSGIAQIRRWDSSVHVH
jgi:hypothetical protein